jgi:hypothetical protein
MKLLAEIRGWSKGWLSAPWLLGLAAPPLFGLFTGLSTADSAVRSPV